MGITFRKLNAGIAVGAASMASASSVAFADGEKMNFSVEGGVTSSEFSRDKLGAPADVMDSDIGLYGSVGVVRDIQPGWDWSASASSLNFVPNVETEEDEDDVASYSHEFDAGFVDFDIGRNYDAAGAQFRIGLGIEALSTTQEKGFSANTDDGDVFLDSDISSSFVGLGPQVSAEGSMEVRQGSPLSIYGRASAALTRGVLTVDKGLIGIANDFDDIGGNITVDETTNVFHGALDVGIEYEVNESTAFRAGIRRDIFRSDSDDLGDLFDDVTSDTAYVGVSVSF